METVCKFGLNTDSFVMWQNVCILRSPFVNKHCENGKFIKLFGDNFHIGFQLTARIVADFSCYLFA